jgi:hypothetical protein
MNCLDLLRSGRVFPLDSLLSVPRPKIVLNPNQHTLHTRTTLSTYRWIIPKQRMSEIYAILMQVMIHDLANCDSNKLSPWLQLYWNNNPEYSKWCPTSRLILITIHRLHVFTPRFFWFLDGQYSRSCQERPRDVHDSEEWDGVDGFHVARTRGTTRRTQRFERRGL